MLRDRLRFLPDIHVLRAVLVPSVVLIACFLDRGYQTDFWYHLARGRAIVSQARLVDIDSFTCTVAGSETRDANWIAQVLFFRVYQWGGLSLVQSINALVIATALAMVFRLCRRAGAGGGICTAITAFAFLGLWQTFLIRPQSVSLLLFALLYHVLMYGSARRQVICCPLIMAAWCNLHGGFPIGLVLIFAFVCSASSGSFFYPTESEEEGKERAKARTTNLIAIFAISLLATLLNPYGWHVYQYAGSITARASGRGIEEWLAPNLHQWIGLIFFASPVLLAICYSAARRRPRPIEICFMLLFFPLACRSVRMTAWWFLAIAPIFAVLLATRFPERESRSGSRIAPSLICLLLAMMAVFSLPAMERFNPLFASIRSPHRVEQDLQYIAAAHLQHPDDHSRIFSRLEWGVYLDWALGPARRVFMDDRIEIYPDPLWDDYENVTSGQKKWPDILSRFGIDYLLLDGTYHASLIAQVNRSPLWERQSQCGEAILYRRRPLSGVAAGN